MRFFLIVIFLIQIASANAQGFCKAKGDTTMIRQLQDTLGFQQNSRNYSGTRPMIRLALHRVTRSDGTGGLTWNQIRTWVSTLPFDFSGADICFTVVSESDIANTNYHNLINDENSIYPNLITTNTVGNAINIYFTENFDGGIATGFLFGNSNHTVVIGKETGGFNILNTPVLSHEIGHCLGLLHTHEVGLTCLEQIPRTGNQANCTNCGDQLCDTPADPLLSKNGFSSLDQFCQYVGGESLDGFPYAPITWNIMSYTRPNCMETFTAGQLNRMRNYILNTTFLDNYVIPFNRIVWGVVNTNNSYSVENNIEAPWSLNVVPFNTNNIASGNVVFQAGNVVILNPGFSTSLSPSTGGTFIAQIGNYSCVNPLTKNSAKTDETSENDNSQIFIEDNFDDISLFPNPVIDKVIIEINATNMTLCDMDIFDVSGRQVYSEKYNLEKGKNAYQFDLKSLSSGFYFAKFNIGGLISMKKFQVESRQ